jgi:hypothetical protein
MVDEKTSTNAAITFTAIKTVRIVKCNVRASPIVLYRKPSGKRWKDVNCGSGQQGRSFTGGNYRLKLGFGSL